MASTTYSFRIDSDLKAQAEAIYGALGQTLSSALNAFLLQSVREGGYPFEMRLDSNERETLLAMLEAKDMMEHPEKYNFRDAEEVIAEFDR